MHTFRVAEWAVFIHTQQRLWDAKKWKLSLLLADIFLSLRLSQYLWALSKVFPVYIWDFFSSTTQVCVNFNSSFSLPNSYRLWYETTYSSCAMGVCNKRLVRISECLMIQCNSPCNHWSGYQEHSILLQHASCTQTFERHTHTHTQKTFFIAIFHFAWWHILNTVTHGEKRYFRQKEFPHARQTL